MSSSRPARTSIVEPAEAPALGACFGFEVRSDIPFSLLRKGSGIPLSVKLAHESWEPSTEPLLEWLPKPGRALHARVFADGDRYRMWTDREGWFAIDPAAPAIGVPPTDDPVRLEERILAIPLLLCFLHRGDLPLHAAAVAVDDAALLLAAPGHHGKTTLAGAFLAAGHRVLTEDIACCRVGDPPRVLPGPAMLRVRSSSRERLDLPNTKQMAEEPGRIHLSLEGPARGDGSPVPLRGVIFLRSDEGPDRLERVSLERAIPDLWSLSVKLPTDADRARCFDRVVQVAESVPLWNLHRALRFETLPGLVDLMAETCLAGL